MNEKIKKSLKIIGIGAVAAGLITTGAQLFPKEVVNPVNIDLQNEVTSLKQNIDKANADINILSTSVIKLTELTDIDKAIIEDYKSELEIYEQEKLVSDAAITEAQNTFTFENVFLNTNITDDLTDREISKLGDDEIDFDGEDYDFTEVLSFDSIIIDRNKNDYNGNIYLSVPEDSIVYKYTIDNLDVSNIDSDETLKINFLGQELEVIDWDSNSITVYKGDKCTVSAGSIIDINDKKVEIILIGEDYVYLKVGEETKKIYEGNTKEVNGIEISAYEVLQAKVGDIDYATLKIGEKVEETFDSGDEYMEDSIWEYSIDNTSISIVLKEEFVDIDSDEDYQALSIGETISLPNDYLTLTYVGLTEEKMEDYEFDITTKDLIDYVRVKGNFDGDDYSKVYVANGTIYDEDYDVIGTSIELGNTDILMNADSTGIKVKDILVPYDIATLSNGAEDLSTFDENYVTDYGIVIKNPEDGIEDNEVELSVPEDKIEAIVTVA